ncbi:MAG: YqjK family protein, partial [Usitatibacteraceae bacterium]
RAEVLARSTAQREDVIAVGARLRMPLAIADHAMVAGRYLRARPLLLAAVAAAAVVVAVRRHRLVTLAGSAMRLWNIYNAARDYSARFFVRR